MIYDISTKFVCYRASEVTEDECKRLLRELLEAGVMLIELDAWESEHGTLRSLKELGAVDLNATLLLAGSERTLALSAGLPVASIGYGRLLLEEPQKQTAGSLCAPVTADILVEGFEEIDASFVDRIMKRAQGLPWITIITRRCYLREITLDDLDDLYALYAGEGIIDYIEPLYDRAREEQYTRDYIRYMYRFYGYGMWLVCDRESGKLIGRAGFSHRDLGERIVLEMGYVIAAPYQRQGYATEVCKKLIDFARTQLSDFGTLNCFVDPGNTASLALLRKLELTAHGTALINGARKLCYEINIAER